MAITQAVCNTFKQELLVAGHNFTITTGDVFKIALFTSTAAYDGTLATYSATNEVAATGGYSTGGINLTNVTPFLNATTTACVDFNPDATWATSTITANGAVIYNSTKANKAVITLSFGGDKSSSAGDFTVVFPAPVAATAIIRIA